jgi:thioredoxin reductase (NADPH)
VLHKAVASGWLDAAKPLVEAGARLDIKDRTLEWDAAGWAEHLNNGLIPEYPGERRASTSRIPTGSAGVYYGSALSEATRVVVVAGLVARDPRGFILTGRDAMQDARRPKGWTADRDPFLFETSVPGIFTVGDARHGAGKRVAAAVGEGSATVSAVHEYLRTV